MERENKDQEFNENQRDEELNQNEANLSDDEVNEENKAEENSSKNSFWGKKSSGKEAKLKEELEKLKEDRAELNDRFLRVYSEFENYKRRTQKEKLELIDTASEKVILDILPVVDDFERAIKANESIEDSTSLKEGFELIYHKLLHILKVNGVEEIKAQGEMFDTDYHDAVTYIPAQNAEDEGRVVDVVQKGYKIKDKVIRYAKVVIAN